MKSLREENAILKDKVRELTAKLNSDSSNSSKPPSSDKPWKERRPGKPTGRSRGGQPGHAGKTREPFPPEQVDHRVPVKPENCGECGHDLGDDDLTGETLAHQVVEIPPVVAEVWEYLLHEARCPGCGETTMAMLPKGVPTTCVGVRFQAILALLTGRYRLSRREAGDTAIALFGPKAEISLGTVAAMEKRTSEALAPAYDEALAKIQIAKDLLEYGAALWTFARVEGIEPTNNIAERALRKAVLWRKNSYGAASRGGSLYAERMLTVCESLRAQGRPILGFLEDSIRAASSAGPAPSLMPASTGMLA